MSNARNLANLLGTGTQITTADIADGAFQANKNLIINGAMQVAQRGTSSTGVSTAGYYTMDRFVWYQQGSTTWNLSQSTVSPDGFAYSYKIEVNNAVASPSSTDYAIISQVFEGQDLQHLDWGTANAKSVTLSFWVRSSITGKFYVELDQSGRWNPVSYTINAADTWEYKTLTFTGDTSTGPDNDNSAELYVYFWLLSGSTYAGGTTTENVWHSTNNADRVAGITNLAASTGDVVYLTGVQLEVGETATPFEHRSYGDELQRCRRYYQKLVGASYYGGFHAYTGSTGHYVQLVPSMRAAPTVTNYNVRNASTGATASNQSATYINVDGFNAPIDGAGGVDTHISHINQAFLEASAEL